MSLLDRFRRGKGAPVADVVEERHKRELARMHNDLATARVRIDALRKAVEFANEHERLKEDGR